MHRINTSAATQDGLFTNGDPGTDVEATEVDAAWLNAVQEEICAVIEGAGVTLSTQSRSQLLLAIQAIVEANTQEVPAATEALAGILKLATNAQALAGTDDSAAMTALKVAAAISGVVRAYTRQQYPAALPLSDLSAIDCDLHAHASFTLAAGANTLPAAIHQVAGKQVELVFTGGTGSTLSYNAGWKATDLVPLPSAPAAGKRLWIVAVSDGTYMYLRSAEKEI